MKKTLLASGFIILALISAILWWPTTIAGRVLHGETAEPLARVSVYLRSDVYKPWIVLSAMAYDNVTTSVRGHARTDEEGKFVSRVFAGLRLDDVSISFRKSGYVVQPNLYSRYGENLSSDLDHNLSSESDWEIVFVDAHAWPAEQRIEEGERRPYILLDGSEKRLRIGKNKQLLILRLVSEDSAGPITIIARYEKGAIRTADGQDPVSLVAPLDGYLAEARAELDCARDTAVVFFLRDESTQYGWVSIDPQSLCQQRDRMRVKYRLSNMPGIRSLVGEREVSG